MKCYVSLVCLLSVMVYVNPAPLEGTASVGLQIGAGGSAGNAPASGGGFGGLTNVLSQIDLPGLLQGVNSFVKLVGVFCPPLSQVLDNVIQNVTSTAFRVFGRAILQGGGLGGGSNGGGQKVSVVLPTFPPDEDDEDYDEEEETESSSATPEAELVDRSGTDSDTQKEAVALSVDNSSNEASVVIETATDTNKLSDAGNNAGTLYTSPVNDESNLIAKRHVRVTREVEDEDQEGAESAPVPEDLSNIEEDDQDRNKRFLPFGGSIEGHASGGSGNFLFDIIRNTADRAARTVGTVYRMVAGTENFGWGFLAGTEQPQTPNFAPSSSAAQLVAGSGATEEADEKANSPEVAEVDIQKSAGGQYTEGIPGPITRLFVIANRGVANLVQDLILRLAQTSERLVNFKARLITSLI